MKRVVACCFAVAAGYGLDEAMLVQRKAETKPNATVTVSVEEQFERGRIDESSFFDAAKCKAKTRTVKDQLLELVTGETDREKQMERVEKLYHTMVSNYSQNDTDRYKMYSEDEATAFEHLDKVLRNEPYDPDYKLWNSFVIGVALDVQPGLDNYLPPALLGDFQMKFVMCLAKVGCKDKDNNVHHYGSVQFCGGVGFGLSADVKMIDQYRPRLVMSAGDYKFQSHGAAYHEIVANWETNKKEGDGILQEIGVKILGDMTGAPVYSIGATPQFIAAQAAEAWKGAKQAMELARTQAVAYKLAVEKRYEKEIAAAKAAADKVKQRASDLAATAGKTIMQTLADGKKWASKQVTTFYESAATNLKSLARQASDSLDKAAKDLASKVQASADDIAEALAAAKEEANKEFDKFRVEWEKEAAETKAKFQNISIGVLKGIKQSTVDVARMARDSLTPDPATVEEEAQKKILMEELEKAEAEFAAKKNSMGTDILPENVDDYSQRLKRFIVGKEETNDPNDPNSALYNWTKAVDEYREEVKKMLDAYGTTLTNVTRPAIEKQLMAKFDTKTNKEAFIENIWRQKEKQTKEFDNVEQARYTLKQFEDAKQEKADAKKKEEDDYWNRDFDTVMKAVKADSGIDGLKESISNTVDKAVNVSKKVAKWAGEKADWVGGKAKNVANGAKKIGNYINQSPRVVALKNMMSSAYAQVEKEAKAWGDELDALVEGTVGEFTKDSKETEANGVKVKQESFILTQMAKYAEDFAKWRAAMVEWWELQFVPAVERAKVNWKKTVSPVSEKWAELSQAAPVLPIWRMGKDWCMVIDDGVPS